jgi:hypothetical protein
MQSKVDQSQRHFLINGVQRKKIYTTISNRKKKKGTSSPKNVQTISFEGIRLKEFEGIWSFFLCMLRV